MRTPPSPPSAHQKLAFTRQRSCPEGRPPRLLPIAADSRVICLSVTRTRARCPAPPPTAYPAAAARLKGSIPETAQHQIEGDLHSEGPTVRGLGGLIRAPGGEHAMRIGLDRVVRVELRDRLLKLLLADGRVVPRKDVAAAPSHQAIRTTGSTRFARRLDATVRRRSWFCTPQTPHTR